MLKKVLVYDDDVDILNICSMVLTMKGYQIKCIDNCYNLLRDIEDFLPQVIIMDNWLPGLGGVKAVQLIKSTEKFKTIPVIFFSANSHADQLAKEAGAEYSLNKPFELEQLHQMIDHATTKHVDML